jgi:hypothetical protein
MNFRIIPIILALLFGGLHTANAAAVPQDMTYETVLEKAAAIDLSLSEFKIAQTLTPADAAKNKKKGLRNKKSRAKRKIKKKRKAKRKAKKKRKVKKKKKKRSTRKGKKGKRTAKKKKRKIKKKGKKAKRLKKSVKKARTSLQKKTQ